MASVGSAVDLTFYLAGVSAVSLAERLLFVSAVGSADMSADVLADMSAVCMAVDTAAGTAVCTTGA